jgi:hypothetical protein
MSQLTLEAAVSPAFVERGCVNVIGLEVIKSLLGLRWERERQSVCARLESIMRHRLGPADFFLALDETSYVVVMPGGEPFDAQVSCLRIAYELHASQLGPCDIGHIRISRGVTLEHGKLSAEPFSMSQMLELTKHAGLHEFLGDQRGLSSRLVTDTGWSGSPRRAHPSRETEVRYAPLWDVRHEAVTTYRCTTVHGAPGNELSRRLDRLGVELARTLGALYAAVDELTRRVGQGERFLVDIPVHFEIVSAPVGRMEIAMACRGLPAEYRPYLVFEITDLPNGVPNGRLNDLVAAVKPFGKAIMAHVPLRATSYAAYQGAGVNAIGITLSRCKLGIGEMIEEIDRLASGARRLSMLSFALDIVHPEVLEHACSAGINLISGPLIGAPETVPSAMRRLTYASVGERVRSLARA